jgi:MoaA/NifB/PqqE/SkfB family radical SAM enzyme
VQKPDITVDSEGLRDLVSRVRASLERGAKTLTLHFQIPLNPETGTLLKRQIPVLLGLMSQRRGVRLRLEGPPPVRRLIGVLSGGLLGGPETLQINIANACNLDCLFCWNHSPLLATKRPASWKAERIAAALFYGAVRDAAAMGADHILFSGRGEPFTHPDIWGFIEAVKAQGIPLTIETNMLRVDRPERLAQLEVERLMVNISAGTADGFAAVHPAQGPRAFHALFDKLRRLRSARGETGPPEVIPTHVIMRENFRGIGDMVRTAHEVGCGRIYFKMMEPSPELSGLSVPPDGKPDLERAIEEGERLAEDLGVEADFGALRYQFSSVSPATFSKGLYRKIGCYMGWYYLRITLDGSVYFCCRDKGVDRIGGGRNLLDIWRSNKYRALRVIAREMDFARGAGFLDAKCYQCPNFNQNMNIARLLGVAQAEMPGAL